MLTEFDRLRSLRTLLAAEEGDPVLFSAGSKPRKTPLEVTDVGGNAEDGYYLVVQGPRGGQYTLKQRGSDGQIVLDYHSGKTPDQKVTNLRFADVDDSIEAEYRTYRDSALEEAYSLMANEDYDYSEWASAAGDAAAEYAEMIDASEQRVILMGAPDNALDTDVFVHGRSDDDVENLVAAVLTDEIVERGSDFSGTSLDATLETKNDVDAVVDKGVVMARNWVDEGSADDIDEAAEAVGRVLADGLTTSDHQAILDFLPRPERSLVDRLAFDVGELVPFGDRATAYERAVAYLAAAIIEEDEDRREAELVGDRETYSIEEFFRRFVGEDFDREEIATRFNVPKLPLLADGGMPHTTLDEATKIYLRDVPVISGDWSLLDGGLVTDGEQRRMIWGNDDGEMVIMASVAHERGDGNDWFVWALDLASDTTNELYDGTSFDAALDSVVDYIKPEGGRAEIEFMNDENTVTVSENINEDALGDHLMRSAGVAGGVAGDAFSMIAPYAKGGGRLLGRVGVGVGKATGRAAERVGGAFWRRYRRQIGEFLMATVGTALLHHGAKVLAGGRFSPIVEGDRIGADFEYSKGATLVDHEGNVSAKNWEAVEFDRDRGEYQLENVETGETVWVAPGEKEDTVRIRKTVNPYKTHIADGTTLAWGIPYERIADVFREWGEDVADMTLGHGDGGPTWKPNPTGSPRTSGGRSGRSGSRSSYFGNSGSSSSSGGGMSSGGMKTKSKSSSNDASKQAERESEKKHLREIDASEDEWENMWDVGKALLETNADGLTSKLGVGMSPSEAAAQTTEDETKPTNAEEIEDAVADADRSDQLRHPNRSEEVDVSVRDSDLESDGGSFSERKQQHRSEAAEKREEAEGYFSTRDPETQDELAETREEAERIRNWQGGEESTEPFDVSSAITRAREMRESRKQTDDEEEQQWREEQRRRAEEQEAFEYASEEGFFGEVDAEQEDPANY